VEEHRTGSNAYGYYYGYDKAGNRTSMFDENRALDTNYVYDVSDPTLYNSQGNRLMYSYSTGLQLQGGGAVEEERWYSYDLVGNVRYVTQRINGDTAGSPPVNTDAQWFTGTGFNYTTGGQIWIARKERWRLYNQNATPTSLRGHINQATHSYVSAMEYRYDSATERYMVRARDPQYLTVPQRSDGTLAVEGGEWHDYNGGIYADYTMAMGANGPSVQEKSAQVPGLAQYDYAAAANNKQHYLHGNLIGTTEAVSGQRQGSTGGAMVGRRVYSAFGEPVSASGFDTRYGYAGAWDYQTAGSGDPLADLDWLHVGARYYEPASGRFVQRDPIGIAGGRNVYAYCRNLPTRYVDPSGFTFWDGDDWLHDTIARGIIWLNCTTGFQGGYAGVGTHRGVTDLIDFQAGCGFGWRLDTGWIFYGYGGVHVGTDNGGAGVSGLYVRDLEDGSKHGGVLLNGGGQGIDAIGGYAHGGFAGVGGEAPILGGAANLEGGIYIR
jgi:RHS repeat-associated protein